MDDTQWYVKQLMSVTMFQLIDPASPSDHDLLAKMHNLRFNIFRKQLNWRNGLQVHSQMEFDEYDDDNAKYLVHANGNGRVDACARLITTDHPNLLCNSFAERVSTIAVPHSPDVCEISRLCADNQSAPRNITGLMMGAFLEHAHCTGINKYVSLSDTRIIPVVKRFGWQAEEIGERFNTGTETSVAIQYTVNDFYKSQVFSKLGLSWDENHADIMIPPPVNLKHNNQLPRALLT